MILTTSKNDELDDDYVDLKYRKLTPAINQIIDICNQGVHFIWGKLGNQQHKIMSHNILYFEWVDYQSCIYTEEQVYTTKQSVTLLEKQLDGDTFIRVSKQAVINVHKVKSISPAWNMKATVELSNGERVVVSRNYRHQLLVAIYKLDKEVTT